MNLPSAIGRGPRRTAALAVRAIVLTGLSSLTVACQTSAAAHSGHLSSYAGLSEAKRGEPGSGKRRDAALSDPIKRVYIEPSILKVDGDTRVGPEDQAMVRFEVDRQICFEVSKHFDLAPAPAPDAGKIRTAIVRIEPTNRAASAVSAAASFFIPVPIVKFRPPMMTGGLAAESELLTPDGQQAAAITWSRTAEVVSAFGGNDPSLSPVGDALQFAEPFGDAVGKAFTAKPTKGARKKTKAEKRKIPDPDPCAQYGPRRDAGRFVGSLVAGAATGLYFPSVAGAGRAAESPEEAEVEPPRKAARR